MRQIRVARENALCGCLNAPRSPTCMPRGLRELGPEEDRPMLHLLAYIDAGSGSLIIQAVIATVVAVPFFLRHHIARLIRSVRGDKTVDAATNPTDHPA